MLLYTSEATFQVVEVGDGGIFMTPAEYIRSHKREISNDWERAIIAEFHELAVLSRGVLLNKVPEVLEALAAWMEGRTDEANGTLAALADDHAVQRLGFGIDLAVVTFEFAILRQVFFKRLNDWSAWPSGAHITLSAGIDCAARHFIRRYVEHRDHVRDQFVGMLGHDLRSPLTATLMTAEGLLQSETLMGEDRGDVQAIVQAAQRMVRLVGDILTFARTQTVGSMPLSPSACDMGNICRAAVAEVQRAHPKQALGISLQGNLVGAFDRDRVFQALVNLLSNAVQHGAAPIGMAAGEADDRVAIVTSVSNGGPAIPREALARLFEPYVCADHGAAGSRGFGLYIVAQIARAHGATYHATSDEHRTTFIIRWPRTPCPDTPNRR